MQGNNAKLKTSLPLLIALALAGCAGAGHFSTPNPAPETQQPTALTADANRFTIIQGRIMPLDSATPGGSTHYNPAIRGNILQLDPATGKTTVIDADVIPAARLVPAGNYSTDQITNLHSRYTLYIKDGKLYRLSNLKSESATPVQISSETGAQTLCRVDLAVDMKDPGNSALFYTLAGQDGYCDNADDVQKMVRVGWDATQTPQSIPTDFALALEIRGSDGALNGFLVREGNALRRYDSNMANPVDVLASADPILHVNADFSFSRNAFIRADDKLYAYNVDKGTLSQPLHGFGYPGSSAAAMDRAYYYFADNHRILRMPLDGSASSTVLVEGTADTEIYEWALTTNKLVYVSRNVKKDSWTLSIAPKRGVSKPADVIEVASDSAAIYAETVGDYIYYSHLDSDMKNIAGMSKEDGTGKQTFEGGEWNWNGPGFDGVIAANREVQTVVLVKAPDAATGERELVAYNALRGAAGLSLGKLPSNAVWGSFSGIGRYLMGAMLLGYGNGAYHRDAFLLDLQTANSLKNVSNTPDKDEIPLTDYPDLGFLSY